MFGFSKKEKEEQIEMEQYWRDRIDKANATCTPADAERAREIFNDIAALELHTGRSTIVQVLSHTIARVEELERMGKT